MSKLADLILVDLNYPSTTQLHGAQGLISDIVYSDRSYQVDSTIVAGRPLMVNRRFEDRNVPEMLKETQWQAGILTTS